MASKKNKEINMNDLVSIKPITDNQKEVFSTWKKGLNQFLFGAAGTGKTFVSLYLALQEIMDLKKPADKVILVRSLIPTREIGFLPGDEEDKSALYQVPYRNMVQFMFEMPNEQAFNGLYDKLKSQGSLYFLSTCDLAPPESTLPLELNQMQAAPSYGFDYYNSSSSNKNNDSCNEITGTSLLWAFNPGRTFDLGRIFNLDRTFDPGRMNSHGQILILIKIIREM